MRSSPITQTLLHRVTATGRPQHTWSSSVWFQGVGMLQSASMTSRVRSVLIFWRLRLRASGAMVMLMIMPENLTCRMLQTRHCYYWVVQRRGSWATPIPMTASGITKQLCVVW